MYHFFLKDEPAAGEAPYVTGQDYNHIRNVLRMKQGEEVTLTAPSGRALYCKLAGFSDETAYFDIIGETASPELTCHITLYQGLPKADKLETIIQKAVELGARRIVPVEMKRSIVKLDDKKKATRLARWQAISESAAKQSGRGIVPEVGDVLTYKQALEEAAGSVIIVPYEAADGMATLKQVLGLAVEGSNLSVFIGPEGGFDPSEVRMATDAGAHIVSLGRRILRTETAGPAILSALMLANEYESNC